jgi:hypothetical protein
LNDNKPKPIIEKITFPEKDQLYIDAMIAGKPTPKAIKHWTDKGMDVKHKTKWYTSPLLKERMRTIQQKYKIGCCHICQGLAAYKLIWKLDGINLVEYYCEKHVDKFT